MKDQHGYPCEPRTIVKNHAWFYEAREGLQVAIGGKIATIKWPQVARAVDRHRKIKAAKPAAKSTPRCIL